MAGIVCWRCGAGLDQLSLPLSRLDECPACTVHLHVCRMCRNFDPAVTKSCREDDAEEVRGKQSANFCDYFKVASGAFDENIAMADQSARLQADALFGDTKQPEPGSGTESAAAGDLFRPDED